MVPTNDAESSTEPKRVRGFWLLAWLVILATVLTLVLLPEARHSKDHADADDVASRLTLEMQSKYFVGADEFPGVNGAQLYDAAEALNVGPPQQRWRFVVLAGELAGANEALKQLDELSAKLQSQSIELSDEQRRVSQTLRQLYKEYEAGQWNAPSVAEDERTLLRQQLGWFGDLALAPEKSPSVAARQAVLAPAKRTAIVMLLAALLAIVMGTAGLAGFGIFIVLVVGGVVRSHVTAGAPHGGVYAETFAVWMVLFIVLGIAAALIPWDEGLLVLNSAAFCLSLTALAWPVLRGVPWSQVRQDIGLTTGRGWFWELASGLIGYISALPLLMVGFLMVLVLIQLTAVFSGGGGDEFTPVHMPSHPVLQWISESGWTGRLQVLLVACIGAPIVEEIMFRGVLYRHLRDCTATWRIGLSVFFSAIVNSFIFAVIHPQGIVAVPALMALALGFSLSREWRGSLLAPMTAHAINNFLVTLVMLAIL